MLDTNRSSFSRNDEIYFHPPLVLEKGPSLIRFFYNPPSSRRTLPLTSLRFHILRFPPPSVHGRSGFVGLVFVFFFFFFCGGFLFGCWVFWGFGWGGGVFPIRSGRGVIPSSNTSSFLPPFIWFAVWDSVFFLPLSICHYCVFLTFLE